MAVLVDKTTKVICQGFTGAWHSTVSRPLIMARRWLAG